MLQNVTNDTPHTKKDTRIPQILQMELQGHTQNTIATKLGVSRMQIYRDRQTDLYQQLLDAFLDQYIQGILDLLQAEDKYSRTEGLKEMGRSIRATLTKRIETKALQITAKLDLDSRRDYAGRVLEEARGMGSELYEGLLAIMMRVDNMDVDRVREDS